MSLEVEIKISGPPTSGKTDLLTKFTVLLNNEGFTALNFSQDLTGAERLTGKKKVPQA
jgi:Ni2+-binding GTPase involved in maturation of urease and hydrogenase